MHEQESQETDQEVDQGSNPEPDKEYNIESLRRTVNRSRFSRFVTKAILNIMIRAKFGGDVSDPVFTAGLFDGSIVGNPLRHPNEEDSYLTVEKPTNSSWISYDFLGPELFPKYYENGKREAVVEGRFFGFLIDEVKDNDPEERTPIGLFKVTDIDHILTLNSYTPPQLIDLGMLAERTYGEAFQRVGKYRQYADELKMRDVVDLPVFQVTPKGNTLVNLVQDSGEPKPDKAKDEQAVWLPADLRPAYVRH